MPQLGVDFEALTFQVGKLTTGFEKAFYIGTQFNYAEKVRMKHQPGIDGGRTRKP